MTFSFGAPAASSQQPAGGGFSFGAPAAAAAQPAAAAAPASTGFTFGGAANPAAPAAGGGFSFGGAAAKPATTAATAAGFGGFGAAAAATTTATTVFGASATTSAPPPAFGAAGATNTGFSFGGGATAATSAAPAAGGLSFGVPAKTTAQGLAFPSTATTTTSAGGLSFGAPAATTEFGAPAATTATAAAPAAKPLTTGLGGVANPLTSVNLSSSTFSGITSSTSASSNLNAALTNPQNNPNSQNSQNEQNQAKTVKETQIPQELAVTVEEFKKFVKEERSVSSDIAHVSSKHFSKIREETEGLGRLVVSLSAAMSKSRTRLERLKTDAAQELMNAETAQRTRDTPPSMQFENVAPYEYFRRLVARFETTMLAYRRQIDETEAYLESLTHKRQRALTQDDVTKAMQKLNATFVTLAGRFYSVHEAVQKQKELCNVLHRQQSGTLVDIFDMNDRNRASYKVAKMNNADFYPSKTAGPSPFGAASSQQLDILATARASYEQRQKQMGGNPPTVGLRQPGGFPSLNQSMNAPGQWATPAKTPGMLGSYQSPFPAAQPFGQSDLSLGKRGKH